MKERRSGDARIYIITGFFFLCVVSGGVLLGLYIFLPETCSQSWYPILGLVLVGIPWMFWLFAYLYRCFLRSGGGGVNPPAATTPRSRTPRTAAASAAASSTTHEGDEGSPVQSPVSPPGRHVHFGAVVVMGSEGNKNVNGEDDDRELAGEGGHLMSSIPESDRGESESPRETVSPRMVAVDDPRESEIPLAFS